MTKIQFTSWHKWSESPYFDLKSFYETFDGGQSFAWDRQSGYIEGQFLKSIFRLRLENNRIIFSIPKTANLKKAKKELDLTRGRPSSQQLDLSNNLESIMADNFIQDGIDTRNYGLLEGLPSARELAGHILNSDPSNIFVNGTSSLTLMGHYLQSLFFQGSGQVPWKDLKKISFLCPVPGYDRHFLMLEKLGIKMIPVPLLGKGPDLNLIEHLLEADESIKGILCVPKHSNPTGEIYSKECIEGLANIKKVDFKVIFDNAYAVHDFEASAELPNIEKIFIENDNHDSLVMLGSTSKISLAGSGLAFLSLSPSNMNHFVNYFSRFSLGSDKVNQARHARIFNSKIRQFLNFFHFYAVFSEVSGQKFSA